jgi:hypothetical protein
LVTVFLSNPNSRLCAAPSLSSKPMVEDRSNTQVPAGGAENIPGYVKRKIRERKAKKNRQNRPEVARTGACARARLLKQAADLADLLADRDASGAIKVLRAGLSATKKMWDGNARDWVEQPDWKTRHDCALAILAYRFGKPIERSIAATGTFEELGQILSRIRASPIAMEELADLPSVRAMASVPDSLQIGPTVTSGDEPTQDKVTENKPPSAAEK